MRHPASEPNELIRMIEVRNVTKYYGRVLALDDVSFRVEPGEIVGLLGPNGSGKTTLMRLLTGFFSPTSGDLRVAGRDVASDGLAVRRHLGYLPENVVLYPDMSVRAFLEFCARVKSKAARQRGAEIDRVLGQCGLQHMARRQIGALSKGYRQRVGLAQALLCDPEVLILDEPTIGLDPHQVIEMRELIHNLAEHATILLSSHILSEVERTCQRVVIIHHGRIIATDTTERLGQRVQGVWQTLVRIGGPPLELLSALRAVAGVTEVREHHNEAPDLEGQTFSVSSADRHIARALAEAVVTHGWDLHELRPVALDLEELFVRLTVEREDLAA